MRYTPTECPKCGAPLAKSPGGGRPTRWCCEGCKRSGESEMSRLQSLLKGFEEGRYVHLLNYDEVPPRRQKVIAEMQARYDHLAGVPEPGHDRE
jgi:predicted amidophosphoribosyltransferase